MDSKCIQTYKALDIKISGRVQGVGFRPFVYKLAETYHVKGTVENNMDGVFIHAESFPNQLKNFIQDIKNKPPKIAQIHHFIIKESTLKQYEHFSIVPSNKKGTSASLVIPNDASTCEECLKELENNKNHRYQYPFITCTQCGPRYTIIQNLPYDRQQTTMNEFEMCERCKSEYNDPFNRRYHAEPIACSSCGPILTLKSINGEIAAEKEQAIPKTINLLKKGKIVAIKGIGGYHLVCDATNEQVVRELRKRKNRPARPLAIMVGRLNDVKSICDLSTIEESELTSVDAPIVILRKKNDTLLAKGISPDLNTFGVMLPYTPIHHLLFKDGAFRFLVVTSANPSESPILYEDNQVHFLNGAADYVLSHNRLILHPLDDSVLQFINGEKQFIRRSRGYVPNPIESNVDVTNITALGSIMKNVFAIGRGNQIFLGPHIGDLRNHEVERFFVKEYEHFKRMIGIQGKVIAMEQHPHFPKISAIEESKAKIITVQHHHAHMVSCMADNQISEPCFGIVLDGTGYGSDGNIWGFEVLYGDASSFERIAHLDYTPLPGGEKAISEPWRNAVGMLVHYFGIEGKRLSKELFPNKEYEIDILARMVESGINSPLAGTCGRLFDVVSAILGICTISTYDGEAAIKLSDRLIEGTGKLYQFDLIEGEIINFSKMLKQIINDHMNEVDLSEIIYRFHLTVSEACIRVIKHTISRSTFYNQQVVLSGGSFHNRFLLDNISTKLEKLGLNVYKHQSVSCNDSGIALGQMIIAAKQNGKGD